MTAFDDLTLAEVEELQNVVLGGKNMADASIDPMMLAGGVLWMTERKLNGNGMDWPTFKAQTTMATIKAFSAAMQDDMDADNPLVATNDTQT